MHTLRHPSTLKYTHLHTHSITHSLISLSLAGYSKIHTFTYTHNHTQSLTVSFHSITCRLLVYLVCVVVYSAQ